MRSSYSRCSPGRTLLTAAAFGLTLLASPRHPAHAIVLTDPGALVSPQRPGAAALDAQALSRVPWVDDPVWSPDGRQVVYTSDVNGTRNVWIVDVDSLKARAVSPAGQDQSSPQWSPDGKRLLFLADSGGDEMYDVFVVTVSTGQVTNVTSSPNRAEQYATWSPDGREIAFAARERDAEAFEIGVIEVNSRKVRMLARPALAGRTLRAPFWSPQGDWLYYHDVEWSRSDSTILRIRPDGSAKTDMTAHRAPALYTLADISPDGRSLLITSNAKNGWQNVAIVDVASRGIDWITAEPATFIAGGFSPDRQTIAFTRNVDADTHVLLHDLAKRTTRLLDQGHGIRELVPDELPLLRQKRSPFSPDGTALLYLRESATVPAEILTARVADGLETTLVATPLPPSAQGALVDAVEVSFPSNDGKFPLHATVWMPPNLKRDGSHPAVVDIHGGPPGQSRARFRRLLQTLASNGYVVISPNYRGSTGYDRAFFRANVMDLGGGDLADVNATAEWIARSGYVDARRIAAYGASYGGYMSLMALSKAPDNWAAGVAIVPLTDFLTAYQSQAPWLRAFFRQIMGAPERNAALWRDRSPLHFAERIRAPVLMVAGANDPRCPPEQAQQIERAIRARGGVVELTIYEEQGHGIASTATAIDENTRVLQFLNRYVRDVREPMGRSALRSADRAEAEPARSSARGIARSAPSGVEQPKHGSSRVRTTGG
jgi:dipeptidyl aminopeptidase/acylaminoacyl peptidase